VIRWVNEHRLLFIALWDGPVLATWLFWKATHRSQDPFPGVVEYLNTHQENRTGTAPEILAGDVLGPDLAQSLEPVEVPEWMKS
jgi:hypothetical protein